MAFDLASPVPLTYLTIDSAGAPANVGVMVLTITHVGTGNTYTPAVTNPVTGTYKASFAPLLSGLHKVRWVGTGSNAQGTTDSFDVYDAAPNYIVSLTDAREILRLTGTQQDQLLRTIIGATTAVIERHLDEVVAQRSFTEDYPNVKPGRFLALRKNPVISITSIATTNGLYTWDPATMHVSAENGLITALPTAWSLWGDITITYVAGRSVIPDNYQHAAKIIIQHLWANRRGTAGAPQGGPQGLDSTLSSHAARGIGWGFAIPNAAIELLGAPVTGFA